MDEKIIAKTEKLVESIGIPSMPKIIMQIDEEVKKDQDRGVGASCEHMPDKIGEIKLMPEIMSAFAVIFLENRRIYYNIKRP